MSFRYPYKKKEEFDDWHSNSCFVDLNGMATQAYVFVADDMYYLWLEQEQDRDELEAEFGLGCVWDESAADCEKFGVRAYYDLDELNEELSRCSGDEQTLFFYEDELLGICGC